ncbi:hypothetical protein QTJ16_001389 [Diplocarpon rosae]|uniref:Peroxin-7 n=1 Tax=Diplocarpon rosae TaxID=946125 RepID=A0AAD9T7Z4_9HELO|nr:hypothetical protein QTJ16_001389 [Diplocarpon rosae]
MAQVMQSAIMEFRTPGYKGYDVKYSPYFDNKVAVAGAANYGLVGNGRGYILRLTNEGVACDQMFDTQDAIYGICWSEINENHVATASGDGSVKIFDITDSTGSAIMNYHEHNKEVYCVAWNLVAKDNFISSSWDGTIKLWSPTRSFSQITLPTHSCTYSSAFSPHSPSIISSVSSDSHLRVYDIRTPASASNHLVSLIPIHGYAPKIGQGPQRVPNAPASECLTHDWNKYREGIIATAGVDNQIRIFDLRNPKSGAIAALKGHTYAVRKIAWSPHFADVLLSGSYDMTARLWTDGTAMGANTMHSTGARRQIGQFNRHDEFVTGVDWCLFGDQGWVVSTGWDERVCIWDATSPQFRGNFGNT